MKKLICVFLVLGYGSVQAGTIIYQATGTLDLVATTGASNDLYSLDGATVTWNLEFDPADILSRTTHATRYTTVFQLVSSEITFDRTGTSGDLVISLSAQEAPGTLETVSMSDWFEDQAGQQDIFTFNGGQANEIADFYVTGLGLTYPVDYLQGDTTFPSTLDSSTANSFYMGDNWDMRYQVNSSVFDHYKVIGLEVAFVPIPAAAWLFGSGLGLLGFLRRRQTA